MNDTDKLRAERDEARELLLVQTWLCGCGAVSGVNLVMCGYCCRPRHECEVTTRVSVERDALRQQLTNAIDERNIARKESTALAGQLAAVTKERDEERARLADETAIVDRIWAILGRPSYEALNGKSIYDLIEALLQRGAELETACSGARQALLRDDLTETFIILDKALAATAPDAQSGATPCTVTTT